MNKDMSGGRTSVQPLGLGRRFKYVARLLVAVGVVLIGTGLFAEAASASNTEPVLTATRATFHIKAGNPPNRVWQLSLWTVTPQKLLGEDSGTSGLLMVPVPAVSGCYFQVDVIRGGAWYSGFKAVVPGCGGTTTSSSSSSTSSSSSSTSSSTSSTTSSSTTSTTSQTPTTVKPKTSGGHGGKTPGTTETKGPATKPATSVASSKLAFTGVGLTMWILALLGLFLVVTGALLLIYARRYPRKA